MNRKLLEMIRLFLLQSREKKQKNEIAFSKYSSLEEILITLKPHTIPQFQDDFTIPNSSTLSYDAFQNLMSSMLDDTFQNKVMQTVSSLRSPSKLKKIPHFFKEKMYVLKLQNSLEESRYQSVRSLLSMLDDSNLNLKEQRKIFSRIDLILRRNLPLNANSLFIDNQIDPLLSLSHSYVFSGLFESEYRFYRSLAREINQENSDLNLIGDEEKKLRSFFKDFADPITQENLVSLSLDLALDISKKMPDSSSKLNVLELKLDDIGTYGYLKIDATKKNKDQERYIALANLPIEVDGESSPNPLSIMHPQLHGTHDLREITGQDLSLLCTYHINESFIPKDKLQEDAINSFLQLRNTFLKKYQDRRVIKNIVLVERLFDLALAPIIFERTIKEDLNHFDHEVYKSNDSLRKKKDSLGDRLNLVSTSREFDSLLNIYSRLTTSLGDGLSELNQHETLLHGNLYDSNVYSEAGILKFIDPRGIRGNGLLSLSSLSAYMSQEEISFGYNLLRDTVSQYYNWGVGNSVVLPINLKEHEMTNLIRGTIAYTKFGLITQAEMELKRLKKLF